MAVSFRRKASRGAQNIFSKSPESIINKKRMQEYNNETTRLVSHDASLDNERIRTKQQRLKFIVASIYILSGATQPLLMTLVKSAGLADKTCQLYMLAYYFGPSLLFFHLFNSTISVKVFGKVACIAVIDIFAQSLNYTGAALAGPTLFTIIYSSVTIWTAVYSRCMIGRKLNYFQWIGIFVVFIGLAVTATDSVSIGPDIFHGALLVIFGSSMHAMTYVLSEAIMGPSSHRISVEVNCAIQGLIAFTVYSSWQIIYTRPRFQELVKDPMEESGTSPLKAILILLSLSFSNLIHAYSFFYTLNNFPGGATSAGIMKGVQAVLVFIFSAFIYCGRMGGEEMCFSMSKFISLMIVITGMLTFSASTDGILAHSKSITLEETEIPNISESRGLV